MVEPLVHRACYVISQTAEALAVRILQFKTKLRNWKTIMSCNMLPLEVPGI